MVFTRLFEDAGGTGGIINPLQMAPSEVVALDTDSQTFKLAEGAPDGTDMFGGKYIQVFRDRKLT